MNKMLVKKKKTRRLTKVILVGLNGKNKRIDVLSKQTVKINHEVIIFEEI